MMELLKPWAEQSIKYRNGEITKEEYDQWCYTYPEKAGFPCVKTIPEIR